MPPRLPARLGYEAAGTVAAIGQGVQGFKVGDAVSTIPSFSLNDYGLYGDLANAPVHAVTHHPTSLSWEEASAVWMLFRAVQAMMPGTRTSSPTLAAASRRAI